MDFDFLQNSNRCLLGLTNIFLHLFQFNHTHITNPMQSFDTFASTQAAVNFGALLTSGIPSHSVVLVAAYDEVSSRCSHAYCYGPLQKLGATISSLRYRGERTSQSTRRGGLVVSVSASHVVGCGFAPRPVHTKDHHKNNKNGLTAWHAMRQGRSLTVQSDCLKGR